MYSANPINDFNAWDAAQEKKLQECPVCDKCGEYIQDDYYDINGTILCEDCMNDEYRITV